MLAPNLFTSAGVGLMAGIIVVYIVGCLAFAYLAGRLGAPTLSCLCPAWPLLLPLAIALLPIVWLAELGERHR